MKRRIPLLLLTLAISGSLPALAAPSKALLIAPGRSIGRTPLGPHGATSLARLPRPDASDSGMSQQRLVWVAGKGTRHPQTLYIHATSNGALNVRPRNGVTIDEIRVTSPAYRTASGVGAGSRFAAIRRAFPGLHADAHNRRIYEDTRRGIAFEFASRPRAATRSIAVTVSPHAGFVEDAATVANVLKGGRG